METELKGKKLLLFGAGKGGTNFIRQNPGLEILAVADNDKKKHGSDLCGYPIISPDRIATLGCDVIVITSVWSNDIQAQLNELGITGIPITIPGKRELKGMRDVHPFSHPPTKEIARELALFLNQLCTDRNIDLYLDFGTLLGAVREHDFIAWDDDIDFSINEEHFENAIQAIRERRNDLPQTARIHWDVELMHAAGHDVVIRITCRNPPGSSEIIPFETDLIRRTRRNGQAVAVGSMPEWYCPEHHFNSHEVIEFLGAKFKVPANPKDYLTFVYGNWGTPRKDMAFSDYAHSGEVDFEKFNTSTNPI